MPKRKKTPQELARENLLAIIPHFRYAFRVARAKAGEGGTVEFAVFSKAKDSDEGHLACHFDPKDFIEDLALALGEDPATIEDGLLDAQAASIVHLFQPQIEELPDEPSAQA